MPLDPQDLRERVSRHARWYHRMELAPGVVTPGVHDPRAVLQELDALGLPPSAGGLRALDVGCRDGFFAFELERRGAAVVGLDYAEPTVTGFSIAAAALGSRVEYRIDNVYDLSPQRHGLFDLILFLGVLYHLRNPVLALDRVRAVARPDAIVFVETQISSHPAVSGLELPVWEFLPRASLRGDASNKWAPNVAGLTRVLEECQLEVQGVATSSERAVVKARAVMDPRLEYFRELDAGTRIWGRRRPPD
jgi:tRNA (mo5U34)-methyltransferase